MKDWTAKRIRALREAAGWTREQMAGWLAVVPKHVEHLETGFRPAGPQTGRLLDILAERVKAGAVKAVQTKKRRKTR
jgi:transcriptional regulator with XRE-family HTH domain